MKITPLDKVTGTLANAGAIKFWLPCDETSGATVTDAVGGLTFAATINGSTAGQLDLSASDVSLSGTLPAPGAGADFALLAVLEKGAGVIGTFYYGSQTGNHKFALTTAISTITGATGTSADLGAMSGTGVRKVLIVGDASGNTTKYEAAIGAALAAGTPAAYSTHGNLTGMGGKITLDSSMGGTNMKAHGVMLLSFAGGALPTNIVTVADWMMESWYDNNKAFYPPIEFL